MVYERRLLVSFTNLVYEATASFQSYTNATNLDIAKAEIQYDQLLLLDSTNLDILRGCADFYRENHRYEKALRLYPKIISHPQAEELQKAKAYGDSGDMLTNIGQLKNAMNDFLQYKNIHEGLLKKNPNASFSKEKLDRIMNFNKNYLNYTLEHITVQYF